MTILKFLFANQHPKNISSPFTPKAHQTRGSFDNFQNGGHYLCRGKGGQKINVSQRRFQGQSAILSVDLFAGVVAGAVCSTQKAAYSTFQAIPWKEKGFQGGGARLWCHWWRYWWSPKESFRGVGAGKMDLCKRFLRGSRRMVAGSGSEVFDFVWDVWWLYLWMVTSRLQCY